MEHEPSFLSALLGLIFVLGIIFLIACLVKRFGSRFIAGMPAPLKNKNIDILELRIVDPKNRLVLFRCRDKEYLILTGETNCVVDSFATRENQEVEAADV